MTPVTSLSCSWKPCRLPWPRGGHCGTIQASDRVGWPRACRRRDGGSRDHLRRLFCGLCSSRELAKPRVRGPEPETLSLLGSWGAPETLSLLGSWGAPLVLETALSGHPWSQWPRRSQPGLIPWYVPRERRLPSPQGNNTESRQGSPTEYQRRGIYFCSQEKEKIYLKLA